MQLADPGQRNFFIGLDYMLSLLFNNLSGHRWQVLILKNIASSKLIQIFSEYLNIKVR